MIASKCIRSSQSSGYNSILSNNRLPQSSGLFAIVRIVFSYKHYLRRLGRSQLSRRSYGNQALSPVRQDFGPLARILRERYALCRTEPHVSAFLRLENSEHFLVSSMIDSLSFLTFMCNFTLFDFCARLCVPFGEQL